MKSMWYFYLMGFIDALGTFDGSTINHCWSIRARPAADKRFCVCCGQLSLLDRFVSTPIVASWRLVHLIKKPLVKCIKKKKKPVMFDFYWLCTYMTCILYKGMSRALNSSNSKNTNNNYNYYAMSTRIIRSFFSLKLQCL